MRNNYFNNTVFIILLFCIGGAPFGQTTVLNPLMALNPYGFVNYTRNENYLKIIDTNFNTKFLDFSSDDGMKSTANLDGTSHLERSSSKTTSANGPSSDSNKTP